MLMDKNIEKIAVFLPALNGGGAELCMLKLAGGLADQGNDVDLVLAKAVGPWMAQIPPSVRLVDLKARSTSSCLIALAHYLRSAKPVAMVAALERANLAALVAKCLAGSKTRIAITIHNTLSVDWRNAATVKHRITRLFAKWMYQYADEIIAVSKGAAEDLAVALKMPRHRIHVIYNPLIHGQLFEDAKAALDHDWYRHDRPPVVISIGRLAPQKNYELLIRAFRKVRDRGPAHLVILGEGPERARLTALVHDLGLTEDVTLPGFIDNPYAYLARSTVYALSSAWEGLPSVLVEALACGLPVVSTDCPSGPRELLADGKFGRLVPMGCSGPCGSIVGRFTRRQSPCGTGVPAAVYGGDRKHELSQCVIQ
jgi:glycosyltransferase involved in cell wall biosynthesis